MTVLTVSDSRITLFVGCTLIPTNERTKMLDQLLMLIPEGNPRHPIAWNRLLKTVEARMSLAGQKYTASSTVRTPLVEMLRWMLLNVNMSELDNCPDDITRLTTVLQSKQTEFKFAFDPIWTRNLSVNKLFRNIDKKNNVVELFLNSSVSNLTDYPLDEGWDAWSGCRGIKILYYNTTTLPISMYTGYVEFAGKPPTYAVISLNVQTLLMKWYKYTKRCKESGEEAGAVKFIKEYELTNFFSDMLDIWTTNVILTALVNPNASSDTLANELSVPNYVTTSNVVSNGIAGLQEVLKLVEVRNLKLQDLLDTKWYYYIDRSIRDMILEIQKDVVLPDLRQYKWMDALKYLPYLRIMVAMIHQDPGNPMYNALLKKAYWMYVKIIKYAQWPNYQYSGVLKRHIDMVTRNFERIFTADKIVDAMEPAP